MKISINISHLFSMIAIIVADVYLGFEYKGNVILIVSYTFLMLYIVLTTYTADMYVILYAPFDSGRFV